MAGVTCRGALLAPHYARCEQQAPDPLDYAGGLSKSISNIGGAPIQLQDSNCTDGCQHKMTYSHIFSGSGLGICWFAPGRSTTEMSGPVPQVSILRTGIKRRVGSHPSTVYKALRQLALRISSRITRRRTFSIGSSACSMCFRRPSDQQRVV